MKKQRHSNTDWIRALAITMVLIHHVGQNIEAFPSIVLDYFKLGSHGVDLFFVLSGWLIGGLYWREKSNFGDVQIARFWGRRWIRTLPPYFVALSLAYLTVYLYRGEPFDFSYLFFLQNYQDEMPFFLISWSLAVEEHFYLILPVFLGLIFLLKLPVLTVLILSLCLAVLSRFIDPSALPKMPFGYASTASHLHFTGLVLGVLLAYLKYFHESAWGRLVSVSFYLLLLSGLVFLSLPYWEPNYRYYFANTIAVFTAGSLLLRAQASGLFWMAGLGITKNLALSSYSIYLTHAMVLNAGQLIAKRLNIDYLAAIPIFIVAIMLVGWSFYLLVERCSIQIRERLVPSR